MKRNRTTTACMAITVTAWLFASAGVSQSAVLADHAARKPMTATFARINNKAVGLDVLNDKIEQLYPNASVHGKSEASPELRQKAIDAVILDELIWQEAVKKGKVTSLEQSQREMLQFRGRYGAKHFDSELLQSGVTREGYVKKLQRALTIQSSRKEHVEIPAQVGAETVRAYYEANKSRFRRPERVRFRLILVAVDAKATKEIEQQAKKKAEELHAKLKAGADFGDVASESSEDMYRVKGGDVGWMHKGSIDKDFEPIVFGLPIGQFTEPFRSSLGFSIVKVEARDPAKDMSLAEVRDKLQLQLAAQNTNRLQQAWDGELKRHAKIEIFDRSTAMPVLPPALPKVPLQSSH